MILKLTVHDNDFAGLLIKFGNYVSTGQHDPGMEPPENTEEHYAWADQWYKDEKAYIKNLKLTYRESTQEQRDAVCDVVKRTFDGYIRRPVHHYDKKTIDYLLRNFSVSVTAHVTETWHNGEVVYVFPTSPTEKPVLVY